MDGSWSSSPLDGANNTSRRETREPRGNESLRSSEEERLDRRPDEDVHEIAHASPGMPPDEPRCHSPSPSRLRSPSQSPNRMPPLSPRSSRHSSSHPSPPS